MRHRAVAALAGIAVFFTGSLLLVDRLTSDDTTPRAITPAAPVETEVREAAADPIVAAPIVPPADATPAPAPAPGPGPVELTPAVSSRLAASATEVRLEDRLEALRARVASRCGALALRAAEDPADPARGLEGEAVLLLELNVEGEQARVTGSKLLSQGTMRPALTACAQHALRNQVFPSRAAAGSGLTIPVVVSMPAGSP